MKILGSPIEDTRIECRNYMIEMTIQEYFNLAKNILQNNEYQRRRVKSSSTVYSLLKEDLKRGCIMPPIVLALPDKISDSDNIKDKINELKDKLIILDGLQRSYTIRDLIKETDDTPNNEILNTPLRVELYTGINRFGILYRMLTYNTGQTQMSTRHQIEIIYSDYIGQERNDINFIKEIDDTTPRKLGDYKFRDVVDGFTSYLERDYLSLERIDILNSIKTLYELTKEDSNTEIFDVFIDCYHNLVKSLDSQSESWKPNKDDLAVERLFGSSVISIFNKSQSLTGFGAAIGKLIDQNVYTNISSINDKVKSIEFEENNSGLDLLISKMDIVRNNAKKIGNDQRLFFYHFFTEFYIFCI